MPRLFAGAFCMVPSTITGKRELENKRVSPVYGGYQLVNKSKMFPSMLEEAL
jgi:hypothetical protein